MAMRQRFPDVERPKIAAASQASLWRPEGEKALEYLRSQRKLSDDTIRKFKFGYCPRGLHQELSGRIIMPLCDSTGEVAYITTRNPWAEKQWQHWHESFDKSKWLYGLDSAVAGMRRTDKAIVVEGQFDAAYAHSVGLDMTVGVCGSAFNVAQASILSRYCSEIYMILDPDDSGDAGVERTADLFRQYDLRSYGMLMVPVSLPEKLDPDDFLQKYGRDALVGLMSRAKKDVLARER